MSEPCRCERADAITSLVASANATAKALAERDEALAALAHLAAVCDEYEEDGQGSIRLSNIRTMLERKEVAPAGIVAYKPMAGATTDSVAQRDAALATLAKVAATEAFLERGDVIERVRALHVADEVGILGKWLACHVCHTPWPCQTIAALEPTQPKGTK